MSTRSTATLHKDERRWFYATLCMFCSIIVLYMYFVSASVVHVVVRKELDSEIAKTSSFVGTLEASYIEAQHSVSADIASLQGFSKTEKKIFIDMTTAPVALLQP